ncbi:vancomycin resistance protein [Clostridium thermosuccinogenes]|jgi:vancomycin resistance protein VanW|uniref:Vancomycin resistance protein n=1 Tax=Clostridium thermosuccinogenes TaxID=84032 RepID=A0A2K2FGJ9_9CLOT|nr:VanW family protein [Pseudoclostridium thermosuccinogenes]AUS95908.1 vancomycin resistance protein [Pseudoclostridium thermosuccinogenes]PNT97905.1 vancomycin resistance protein [Pseudoclostridium thermosuccinogenes]PNT99837.1 vancomycin resistance protein [Pseudoclostridium thermosuccinogenes]
MMQYRFVKRSPFRIFLGRKWFTLKRYVEWCTNSKKYAKTRAAALLPEVVFTHKTPLVRQLDKVDMWMQHNKIINLRIAAKKLDGVMIYPGETFSYWRLIGKPTYRKGYVDGMVLVNGKVSSGVGGGLCQMSNLIYWMTLHTPLTVTERYRHSHDVFPDSGRTQPFGSGATCVYNYIDLQMLNETDMPYQLHVYLTDSHLVGEWRAVKPTGRHFEVYEKKHWITHEFWGDYMRHNIIFRRVYNASKELIADEYITENHAVMMYSPFLAEANETCES